MSGASGKEILSVGGGGFQNLFGRGVCGLGDIDHDGIGDFAAGAPHEDVSGMDSGRVLVYRGAIAPSCTLQALGRRAADAAEPPGFRLFGTPSREALVLLEILDPPPARFLLSGLRGLQLPRPAAAASTDGVDGLGILVLDARGWLPAMAGTTARIQVMNVIEQRAGLSLQPSNALVHTFGL